MQGQADHKPQGPRGARRLGKDGRVHVYDVPMGE